MRVCGDFSAPLRHHAGGLFMGLNKRQLRTRKNSSPVSFVLMILYAPCASMVLSHPFGSLCSS